MFLLLLRFLLYFLMVRLIKHGGGGVVDKRMIQCTGIRESQFGFMHGSSTTDAIFILKQTIEKHG